MKTIIGKVYANWCGHCQQLKPEWDTMKSLIKNKENKDIEIVEFEENEKEKLDEFKKKYSSLKINGYPTIFKILPNKQIEYYTGNRMSHDMAKWVFEKRKLNNGGLNKRSVKKSSVKKSSVKKNSVKKNSVKKRSVKKRSVKNI
jgi:thiol-disulfide isomerase/thioredoxin